MNIKGFKKNQWYREIQRQNERINDIIKGRGRFSQEIIKRNDDFNVLSRQSVKSSLSKFLQKG